MHGVGMFDAPDGTRYQGSWFKNHKHGLGKKVGAQQAWVAQGGGATSIGWARKVEGPYAETG